MCWLKFRYVAAFLSTFDAFLCRKWCQLEWATLDLWDTLKLEIRELMASSLLRSLPSLLFKWLDRSGMSPQPSSSTIMGVPAQVVTRPTVIMQKR